MNTEKLKALAKDLRKGPPPSPHEKLGGYVIAARSLVKCRAFLLGMNGEYNFHPCGLSAFLWKVTGITPDQFKEFVATGAGDDEVAAWLSEHSKVKDAKAIVRWNHEMKCKLISELPDSYLEYYETYIPQFCPHPNKVRFFFDVYDDEEGRLIMSAMAIHPTAIISPKAELDSSVEVGPHAIIEEHVKIGAGTKVWANAYLTGHTEIGRDNQIHMGAVIGHEPQDLSFKRETRSYLRIGDRNVFREYCNVHRGTEPDSATVIGNDCYIMATGHVGHNCVIGNGVIICNCALVAGHVHVGDRAFISGGVVIHQFTHIGRLAMFSGNARVSMDVPPFTLAAERNEIHALNLVGLRRAKISREAISELKRLFQLFYLSGKNGSEALKEADGGFTTAEAREFIEFVQKSPNGLCPGPQR